MLNDQQIENLLKTVCYKVIKSLEHGKDPRDVLDFMHRMITNIKKSSNESIQRKACYPEGNYLVVDAACSKNPGPVEYRGVFMPSGEEYFRVLPFEGTNNLGEFLAIVHGLAQMEKDNINLPIYSDSQIAISWVTKKVCKTDWEKYDLWGSKPLADRAINWLMTHSYTPPNKWETKRWGEIPADYGRK